MLPKRFRNSHDLPVPDLPLAFTLPQERRLQFASGNPSAVWRFLSHHICRYPQDLRAHTQRILLAHREAALHDRLAGSLLDLFIALGKAGAQLKGHLLERVGGQLPEAERQALETLLQQEGDAGHWLAGSVLATGQGGRPVQLVTVQRTAAVAQYASVMDEVLACLEYGQVDAARGLLELEVLAGRADDVMQQELVNIYEHTRDKDALSRMVKHMQDKGQAVPPLWLEKQQQSVQW